MRDPAQAVMQTCLALARAQTGTGALDWMEVSVSDLPDWIKAVEALEKQTRRKK